MKTSIIACVGSMRTVACIGMVFTRLGLAFQRKARLDPSWILVDA
jgi:hypothetical protein